MSLKSAVTGFPQQQWGASGLHLQANHDLARRLQSANLSQTRLAARGVKTAPPESGQPFRVQIPNVALKVTYAVLAHVTQAGHQQQARTPRNRTEALRAARP